VEASEDIDEAIWRSHPEHRAGLARDTAHLIVGRVAGVTLPEETASRIRAFVQDGGLDDIAPLWSDSPATSLPGALWRLYRVRDQIVKQPADIARLVALGHQALDTIDPIVAGLDDPVTAQGVVELADTVFFGALEGQLQGALMRAGALAKLVAAGLLAVPHDQEESFGLARTSLAWGVVAEELVHAGQVEATAGLS
jgi:hypothetical protein